MLCSCRAVGQVYRKALMSSGSLTSPLMTSAGPLLSSSPSPQQPKPPNVLIYQPDKDPGAKGFLRTKDALESCLTPERYVIYPLGDDDIINHTPWKENCRLLVLPPPSPPTECVSKTITTATGPSPRVIGDVLMYAQQNGGRLLSMQPALNKVLGLRSVQETLLNKNRQNEVSAKILHAYCQDAVCNVTVAHSHAENSGMESNHRFPAMDPNSGQAVVDHSDTVYLEGLPLSKLVLESADKAVLEQNADQPNNMESDNNSSSVPSIFPCVRSLALAGGGQAVLSSVDLLPSLPEGLSLSPLLRLKEGVALRGRFLSEVLKGLGLECSEEKLPELTHTYLLASEKHRSQFLSAIKPHLHDNSCLPGNDLSLQFLTTDYTQGTPVDHTPSPSPSRFTVVTKPAQWQLQQTPFSQEEYFSALETRELGRTVLYTPVITSTQLPFTKNLSFAQCLQQEMGVVWVASQQTKGKGRGGNAWISPRGSSMFSTVLPLSPESRLAHHLPLLQHIVGVAVVHGVRSREGYSSLPLAIKWPNDVYYQDKVKLGGVLVSCLSVGSNSSHMAVIGCGVNVSNQYPTMSINDCITLYNRDHGTSLPLLTVEEVLASTFNTLETLLSLYQVQGLQPFLQLYYQYWLHSDASVYLESCGEKVHVVGLDKYGYLLVRKETGQTLSLQPDGNSFDIMKGLIVMKN